MRHGNTCLATPLSRCGEPSAPTIRIVASQASIASPPSTSHARGQFSAPSADNIGGSSNALARIPIPPPPTYRAMPNALCAGLSGQQAATSAAPEMNIAAPPIPARIRNSDSKAISPVIPDASNASAVISMPRVNNRAAGMRPLSQNVSNAPKR